MEDTSILGTLSAALITWKLITQNKIINKYSGILLVFIISRFRLVFHLTNVIQRIIALFFSQFLSIHYITINQIANCIQTRPKRSPFYKYSFSPFWNVRIYVLGVIRYRYN